MRDGLKINNTVKLLEGLAELDILKKLIEVYPRSYTIVLKRYPEVTSYINEKINSFGLLNKNLEAKAKIWHVVNNVEQIPKCCCGKECNFKSVTAGYFGVCMKNCSTYLETVRKDQIKQTCIERYGVENITQSEIFKEKTKQTCLDKYGVEHHNKSPEIANKISQTKLNRSVEDKASTSEKYSETMQKNYGASNYFGSQKFKEELFQQKEKEFFTKNQKYFDRFNLSNVKFNQTDSTSKITFTCNNCTKENECENSKFIQRTKYYQITPCICCKPIRSSVSGGELELKNSINNHLSAIGISSIGSYRGIKGPNGINMEIDIYIPELKLGIEYNGIYWHSAEKKGQNYHSEKVNICEKEGIHLVQIFEDDVKVRGDIVDSKLVKIIGSHIAKHFPEKINDFKEYLKLSTDIVVIPAKEVVFKKISQKDANDFLLYSHLEGRDTESNTFLGCFHGNNIVGVVGMNKVSSNEISIQNEAKMISINRISEHLNYRIPGLTKILTEFIKTSNYAIDVEKISIKEERGYSDINNNDHTLFGFELDKVIESNSWYSNPGKNIYLDGEDSIFKECIKNIPEDKGDIEEFIENQGKRYFRMEFTKDILLSRYPQYNGINANSGKEYTIDEIAEFEGFTKVYDCGQLILIAKL